MLADLAEHTLVSFKGPTDELERDDALMLLAYALQESFERLGASDPFISATLKGRPAADVAREAILSTKIADPAA